MGNSQGLPYDENDLRNMSEGELINLKQKYEQNDDLAKDEQVIDAIDAELNRRENDELEQWFHDNPLRSTGGAIPKPVRKVTRKRASPKRKRASPKRKRASPKRKRVSPKRKTMKLTKKSLDSLSLKKLQKLAVKHKVSIFKKGAKKTKQNLLKKSTLLTKMKKSRSINKILLSAHKMKYSKKSSRFGQTEHNNLINRSITQTASEREDHYMKIPKSFLTYNYVDNIKIPNRAYGTSSLPVMNYGRRRNRFGQYFQ